MTIDWVIVTGTVWSTALVLGRLSESLRQRADTDQLTGLLNRNGFLTAVARERAIAERTRTPLTLAVLDLNGFKQVNDRFGHAAGDRLLVELAGAWRERLRAGDILARHGGDEFVLLLPATSPAEAGGVLERLRDGEQPVDWSIGLSEWRPGEDLGAASRGPIVTSTASSSPVATARAASASTARDRCCPRPSRPRRASGARTHPAPLSPTSVDRCLVFGAVGNT